jgi:hypothetical protein
MVMKPSLHSIFLPLLFTFAVAPPPFYTPLDPSSSGATCSSSASSLLTTAGSIPRSGVTSTPGKVFDLGSLDLFSCIGKGSSTSCALVPIPTGISQIQSELLSPLPGSPLKYAASLLSYAILNFILAILVLVCTILVIFCRYCTSCFCKANECTILKCGLAHPTRGIEGCSLCGWGFVKIATKEGKPIVFGYGWKSRLASYLSICFFASFLFSLFFASHFYGNKGLSSGMHALFSQTNGLGSSLSILLQGFVAPITELLISLSDTAMVPMLLGINESIHEAINFPAMISSLNCVNASVENLPNVAIILGFLNALQSPLIAINSTVNGMNSAIFTLVESKEFVLNNSTSLSLALSTLNSSIQTVSITLSSADTQVTRMSNFYLQIAHPINGLLVHCKNDLLALNTSYPPFETFRTASGPPTMTDDTTNAPTLNGIITGNLTSNSIQISILVNKLTVLNSALSLLPDLNQSTAAKLEQLNALMINAQDNSTGVVTGLTNALNNLSSSLKTLPSAVTFSEPVYGIQQASQAVDVVPLLNNVQSIKNLLSTLPDFNLLLDQLDKVSSVKDILPCLVSVVSQLGGINSSLAILPPGLDSINELVNNLNSTANDAIAASKDTRKQILETNTTINSLNISSYLVQLYDVNMSIAKQRDALNVSSLLSQLSTIDNERTGRNFTSNIATLTSLRQTLSSSSIDNVTIAGLRSLQSFTNQLRANISTLITEYTLLAKGYCLVDPSLICTVNSDCPSGTCSQLGIFRCSGSAQATICSQDSQCPSGSKCLADRMRAIIAHSMIVIADTQPPSGASTAISKLSSAQTSADEIDLTGASTSISSARSSITAIDINSYQTTLVKLGDSFSSFNIAETSKSLTDISSSIDKVDFKSFEDQLTSVESSISDFKNGPQRSMLSEVIIFLKALQQVFQIELGNYLSGLSRKSLQEIAKLGGPGVVFLQIASVFDAMLATMARSGQTLMPLPSPYLTDLAMAYSPFLDKLSLSGSFASSSQFGSLFYIAQLFSLTPLENPTKTVKYIYGDTSGSSYSKGALCLSTECLSATSDALNTQPLSQLPSAFPLQLYSASSFFSKITISREGLFLAPWAFPLLVIALALIAVIIPALCCKKAPGWQKVPISCMVGAIICQLPCILIAVGIAFPITIFISDMCNTGANIGYNFVLSEGDGICTRLGAISINSTSRPGTCLFNSVPFLSNITLDIPAASRGILSSQCAMPGSLSDPFYLSLSQAASSIETMPVEMMRGMFGQSETDAFVRPRPYKVIINASISTGRSLSTFVKSLAIGPVSCSSLGSLLQDVRGAVCCQMEAPLLWYVSSWYLAAWAMLLCGIPFGCCGRKRLPSEPWGPAYQQALDEAAIGDAGEGRGGKRTKKTKKNGKKNKEQEEEEEVDEKNKDGKKSTINDKKKITSKSNGKTANDEGKDETELTETMTEVSESSVSLESPSSTKQQMNSKAAKMASKVKGKVAVVTAISALTMKSSKNSSDKNKNESEKDEKKDKIVVMEEEEEEEMDEEEEVISDDIDDDAIIDMDADFGMASPPKSPRSGGDVNPGKYLKPMVGSSAQKSSSKTFTIAIKRRASRLALRTVPVQEEKVVESRSIDDMKKNSSKAKRLHALEDIDIDFK